MNKLDNYSRQIKRLIGFVVIFLIIFGVYSILKYIKNRKFSDAINVSEQFDNEVIMLHPATYNTNFKDLVDALQTDKLPKDIKIQPQYITIEAQINNDVSINKDNNLLVASIVNNREGLILNTIIIETSDIDKNLMCINNDKIVKIKLTDEIFRLQSVDEDKFYYSNFVKNSKDKICFVPGIVKKQDDLYVVVVINVKYIKNANALYFVNQIIKSIKIHSREDLEGYKFSLIDI